jgi:hypothetical protein
MEEGDGFEPQFFELVLGHDQAGGARIVLLAGVARGHHAAFEGRSLPSESERGVGAVAFVVIEDQRHRPCAADATGTSSSANSPAPQAAAARWWLRAA